MLGVHKEKVKIVAHDPRWAKLFDAEARKIRKTLKKNALAVEHVGSTAIKGLSAKPILDLLVVVPTLTGWEKYKSRLKKIGYTFRIDHRKDRGSILFTKGPEHKRTHHLKLVTKRSSAFKNSVFFRDYLMSHPKVAREYEKLKKDLVEKFADKRELYTQAKTDFVKKILRRIK